MNEDFIADLWNLIKEYSDKKQLSVIAEKFVDILSDNGATDQNLENSLGHDDDLDEAIKMMLDIEEEYEEDEDYDDE